jgi:DNA polymerase-3 subunit delta'
LRGDRFPQILGQARTLDALDRALSESRLAPALLFHGPAGVGKLSAAIELCRHLLCPSGQDQACRVCDLCRRVSATSLLHPDLSLLFPQRREDAAEKPAGDAPLSAPDLHAIQEEARRNPAWRILAQPTRDRLAELFLSPAAGARRILLILGAERLQEESGNALLKVLEEPPARAVLILLSENPSALLPTLRSRCRAFPFGTLSRGEIATFLTKTKQLPSDQANFLVSLSGGRVGRALAMAEDAETYRELRERMSAALAEARRQNTAAAALAAASDLEAGGSGHDPLAILSDLLRDAMLSDCGAPEELRTYRPGAGRREVALPAREAALLLGRVERAREDLRRHVNRALALESLFLDLVKTPPEAELE